MYKLSFEGDYYRLQYYNDIHQGITVSCGAIAYCYDHALHCTYEPFWSQSTTNNLLISTY